MNDDDRPIGADQLLDRLTGRLSLRARLRLLVLLLAAATVSVLTGTLWATEPDLPARTQLAFAGVIAIGAGWTAYAASALRRCGRLFALDRILAAWLALLFAILAVVGAALIEARLALLFAAAVPVAALLLARAYAARRRLRRHELRLRRG